MDGFLFIIFQLTVLIFSVMIHEVSHGFIAERLGDPTARLAGRLTMNPLRHIDPVGSVLLPLILVVTNSPVVLGWAKPVPYNPFNLSKDMKYGPLKVALAGPASNFLMLLIFGFLARFGAPILPPILVGLFAFIAYLNAFLGVFNLIPIPPLDGSKLLSLVLPRESAFAVERMGLTGILLVFLFIMAFSGIIFRISSALFVFVAGEGALGVILQVITAFSAH